MDKKNNKYITGKNSVLDAISNKLKIKKIYATYQYQNVLEKFNIPLTHNGTMSITAKKVIRDII